MNQHSAFSPLTALTGRVAMQDELPQESQSRRELMRRLAALGLTVASGTALSTLDAEGKGKNHGKQKGHGKDRSRGKQKDRKKDKDKDSEQQQLDSGGEDAAIEEEVTLDNQEAEPEPEEDLVEPDLVLADPSVSTSFSISGPFFSNGVLVRRVSVSGSIFFNSDHLGLLNGGRDFALECRLYEVDGTSASSVLHLIQLTSPSTFRYYLSTASPRTFAWSQNVRNSLLTAESGTDEIRGRLRLWTRASATSSWGIVPSFADFPVGDNGWTTTRLV